MNILRSQYYGGLSVFAFYEAMNRNVEPDVLQEILWRMPLMNCPVAAFAKKHGYEHLMPLFCGSDFKVAERYGLRLIRRHTEAEGFPDCDFWYLMENDVER